jgi:hypothetical protein
MQRHCRSHSCNLAIAIASRNTGDPHFQHMNMNIFLSYHHNYSTLPNDIHIEIQRGLSHILHASNESGVAVIETILRLETRLEVSHIT